MQKNNHATKHEIMLYDALRRRGINAQLQYPDGHKTVDIAVLDAKLYIEVDDIKHFIDPEQIMRDFKRVHYSDGDDFSTFFVTNQILDFCLDGVADALVEVIKKRKNK